MLRQRLITGPLLILALLALLWGDGRAAELLREDARVRGMLGSSDGVVLTGFALLVLAPLVLLHLAVILYAVTGGLSAGEILGRTRSSLVWPATYGVFAEIGATRERAYGFHLPWPGLGVLVPKGKDSYLWSAESWRWDV